MTTQHHLPDHDPVDTRPAAVLEVSALGIINPPSRGTRDDE